MGSTQVDLRCLYLSWSGLSQAVCVCGIIMWYMTLQVQVEEGTVNAFHPTAVAPPLPQQNSTEVHQQVGLKIVWELSASA